MMWFSKPAKIILAVGLVAILGTCGPQKTGGGAPAGGGTPVNTGGGGGLSAPDDHDLTAGHLVEGGKHTKLALTGFALFGRHDAHAPLDLLMIGPMR